MLMQSDARFEYKAQHGRQPQNLLKDPFGFTCAPGMLCPIFADFASPGDTYYIQHDLNYLRTLPLVAPAMVDVKVHYESYFVPIQMLYQPFEQSYFELTDTQSSFYTASALMGANFPLFDYANYVTAVKATGNVGNYKPDAYRFADFLQLNPFNFCNTAMRSAYGYTPSFFPWQVLAYHAIYQYVYRLDDKSSFANDKFNWDSKYATSFVQYAGTSGFFNIYQRPWDFDYFSSLYRSPIVSDANVQQVMGHGYYSDLVPNVGTIPIQSDGNWGSNENDRAFSSNVQTPFLGNAVRQDFSTAAIRQMFANEKLAMITGRTRKTYDAQVLAHFGVKVPHDPKHDIAKIGRDTYHLRVGEVTSLATTLPSGGNPGTALGDLAGKGYIEGGNSKGHKFTCPCHGVVMTIFSVEPSKRYFGGFGKQNAVTDIFDFPVPEFDKLGNQPMFRYEAGNRDTSSHTDPDTGEIIDDYLMTDQIGWNKRYQQWKSRFARATSAFMPTTPDRVNQYNSYMIVTEPYGVIDTTYTGVRSGISRPDQADRFYIDRGCLNGIMTVPFAYGWKNDEDGENWELTPWLVYARDPFIVDSFEKVTKVSWMSLDGEPVYPW